MKDSFATAYVHMLEHGPSPAPKRLVREWVNGEIRIIVPADPEKLRVYREHMKHVGQRRIRAGLEEENISTWGRRR